MSYKTVVKVLLVFLVFTLLNITPDSTSKITPKKVMNYHNTISPINYVDYTEAILSERIEKNIYEDLLATISIKKINILDRPIYKPMSKKNNINKNISILSESSMPDNNSSIIFLLAHSGIGEKAYFKNLHKLVVGDIINLSYNNIDYIYKVMDIYEVVKDGYLEVTKEYEKELVLTTCSENKDKQLIVVCELLKESDID